MKIYYKMMAVFLIVIVGFVLPAMAIQNDETALDTITVTAQKQEENVQDVPLSISVFSEQGIEDRMIDSVVEIADFVPNLTIFENGATGMNSPSTRGIHAFVESMTVSTGLFIDGIPVLSASGFEDTLIDIEQIEVLRGPQGTLYGKNTEAGVINIITQQPNNIFRGQVSGELGEDEKRQLTFNLSGPIMEDKLFFGVSGKYYEKEGFIDNTFTGKPENDRSQWYGKGQLRWTPTDKFDISLFLSRLEYDDAGNNMNLTEDGKAMFGLPAPEYRSVASDFEAANDSVLNMQNLKVTYNFSDTLKLTSISSNRVYDDKRKSDWDLSPYKLMHNQVDSQYSKLSQELRLASSTDQLKWLVGVYYDRDDNDVHTQQDSMVPSMITANDREFEGDAYAVFGQISYPFMDRFRLTAGLRYENQDMEFTNNVASTQYKSSWDEVSPKVALDCQFSSNAMLYISVSKGYRSGGFNTYATDSQYVSYDEEKLWSYETGLKTTWLDQRLIVNGALFYMEIENMHVSEAVTPMEAYLTNAGEASAIGGEIDITANLFKGLSLVAGFGYTNIEFDKFSDAAGDYEGNKNPYAPEYTFNVGAQYRSTMGLYVRGDLIGCGKVYFDKENEFSRDPYEIVNVKIGYEEESWDVYLYGKNIFDEEYDDDGIFGGLYTVYSAPREIGAKLTYRF